MEIQAVKVIGWIDTNLPPLSWRIISMKIFKLLFEQKIYASKIDESTYFNAEILDELNTIIKKDYGKDLPNLNEHHHEN
jgi:hypothetical protein